MPGIGQDRFAAGRPPIGNPKGRAVLRQSRRKGSRTYPDMPFDPLLGLVTKPRRQNEPIWSENALDHRRFNLRQKLEAGSSHRGNRGDRGRAGLRQ